MQILKCMVHFTTTILKFNKKGEKTGWTYIEVPADVAQKLKPGNRKEFKVKGKLDNYSVRQKSVMPIGGGDFIMPLNAEVRKKIHKRHGDTLAVQMEEDKSKFTFNADLMVCLNDEPAAIKFFKTLPGSHQRYFSKWIDSAKTSPTKTKRIALAVNSLSRQMGYGEMLRSQKNTG